MDTKLISFASDDSDEVALPDSKSESAIEAQEIVKSIPDIKSIITRPTVSKTITTKVAGLKQPNFVLDISGVEKINHTTIKLLNDFSTEGGDSSLYIKTSKSMFFAGDCDTNDIVVSLRAVMGILFDGKAKLYKNYGSKKQVEIKSYDISNIRLDL